MAIVRWRPYRDVTTLQDEMNSLLETFLGHREPEAAAAASLWGPRVDIHETKDGYLFDAELPGVTKEDIKLTVHDNTLTLEGEKKYGHADQKDCDCHRQERIFGKFQRSFSLPMAVDSDKIEASFESGVLTIHLAKKEIARPKEIPIAVK
ncbi:MAG: Hsp20/alpha crystallin family protein [Candidatus Eisenbacteria bacterium]|jgi:HSP20 family protein|nr:Hsp20/alpha crystallin family protein [Candidatus Eisenbacteria bacterium]